MHRSRLAGFIIDCNTDDLDTATRFWSVALGMAPSGREGEIYERLDAKARDLHIEVQKVKHESRVHLDIESDNVDAEVERLEKLGARRLQKVNTWWVMEAPTGQRFCVIEARWGKDAPGVNSWPQDPTPRAV
jgi:hypothetical protein